MFQSALFYRNRSTAAAAYRPATHLSDYAIGTRNVHDETGTESLTLEGKTRNHRKYAGVFVAKDPQVEAAGDRCIAGSVKKAMERYYGGSFYKVSRLDFQTFVSQIRQMWLLNQPHG